MCRGNFVNKRSRCSTIVTLRHFDDAHGVTAYIFDFGFTLGHDSFWIISIHNLLNCLLECYGLYRYC